MSDIVLPKRTYKRVLKAVEFYRQQDDEDIRENPDRIRIGWRSMLKMSIQQIIREDRVPTNKEHADAVIEYLIRKKILVRYCGDVSFPDRSLPSSEEIANKATSFITGKDK